MECFKCGVTSDKAILFEVVSPKGVVTICNSCYKHENMPLVEKRDFRSRVPETSKTVHERLVAVSGVDNLKKRTFEDNKEILKKNLELKELVDTNFVKTLKEIKPRDDMLPNFHWIVMRARRSKHLTQKQFADALGEPEISIKMLEQGVLGENGNALIKKIENFLDVNLIKRPEMKFESNPRLPREIDELSIDRMKNENYTLSKISEISKDKIKEPFWKSWMKKKDADETKDMNKVEVEPHNSGEKKELSDEEIDDILFGRN